MKMAAPPALLRLLAICGLLLVGGPRGASAELLSATKVAQRPIPAENAAVRVGGRTGKPIVVDRGGTVISGPVRPIRIKPPAASQRIGAQN